MASTTKVEYRPTPKRWAATLGVAFALGAASQLPIDDRASIVLMIWSILWIIGSFIYVAHKKGYIN